MRTCDAPSKPSAGSARSTVWPWGSRIPSFGRMRTRALTGWLSSQSRGRRPHAGQPGRERLAGDPLVGILVTLPRAVDHLVGDRGRRRRLVPARLARPVAHVLLVKRRLGAPGLVAVGRPEAGAVGREHLVADHDPSRAVAAELELRVG